MVCVNSLIILGFPRKYICANLKNPDGCEHDENVHKFTNKKNMEDESSFVVVENEKVHNVR